MSESENFVARWSRLKRDTANEKTEAEAAQSRTRPAETTVAVEQGPQATPPEAGLPLEPAFDPASLPPIESITADSDIRAFLQSGVPAELTKAALRRVWTTDPAIRDFIGIAENQWDFTDPTAMPGFGPLEDTDDVRDLVAQAMGKLRQVPDPAMEAALSPQQDVASTSCSVSAPLQEREPQVTGMPAENELSSKDGNTESLVEPQNTIVNVATQHRAQPAQEEEAVPNRRAHGRALPR